MRFFNEVGTSASEELPSGPSMDLPDVSVFESLGSNEAQWEQILQQLAP